MRLYELERKTKQNTQNDIVDELSKYQDRDNVFISLQRIKKLGINPNFEFEGSPSAIYAYHLPSIFEDIKKYNRIKGSLPFGSNRPYLFVFEVSDMSKVINVETYTKSNLKKDLLNLKKHSKEHKNANWNGFFRAVRKMLKTKYPLEILMKAIAELSEGNSSDIRSLFVKLGYYGITDQIGSKVTFDSKLAIKESMFFSKKHIKILDILINDDVDDEDIVYKDGEEFDLVGSELDDFDPYTKNDSTLDILRNKSKKKPKIKMALPQHKKTRPDDLLVVTGDSMEYYWPGEYISKKDYEGVNGKNLRFFGLTVK